MRKTPKEITESYDGNEQRQWLFEASIPELHEFIQRVSTHPYSTNYQLARTALEVRISEAAERSSQRMERQTTELISLTRGLLWWTKAIVALTVGLLLLTAALLFYTFTSYQDVHAQIQRDAPKHRQGTNSAAVAPTRPLP